MARAVYARMFSSNIPDIVDRNGHPPEAVDPTNPSYEFSLPENITDHLQVRYLI